MMRSVLDLAPGIDPFHFGMRAGYICLTVLTGLYAMGCLS